MTNVKFYAATVLLCLSTVHRADGQTIQDIQNLQTALLDGYNRDIRPVEDQSQPVFVNITFDLISIQEFDEVSETFTVVGLMNLVWVDLRMRWDPSLYNNTHSVNIRKEFVWIPDLILTTAKERVKPLGDRQDWMMIRYFYDGTAFVSPGDVFQSTCKVDVTFYPFDVQSCEMSFLPWGLYSSEVYLHSTRNEVLKSFFSENGEWRFKGSEVTSSLIADGAFSMFSVEITMERRATFILVNIVIPIIFMSFLNVLVFWVPAESGERVSYAITVLLAIAVFLTIVGDNMPKTSQPMSILCYFLIINLALSSLICIAAIFNLNIYFKYWERPVPMWLDAVTRVLLRKRRVNKTPVEDFVDQIDAEIAASNGTQKMTRKHSKKWVEAVGEITGNVPRDHKPVTWREVSYAIDKIFGTISLLWLVVSASCFVIMVATHHSP